MSKFAANLLMCCLAVASLSLISCGKSALQSEELSSSNDDLLSERDQADPESRKQEFEIILRRIENEKLPSIDALNKSERETLRRVFNSYFANIRSPIFSKEVRNNHDPKITDAVVGIGRLCIGKEPDYVLDFFGKPTDIVFSPNAYNIYYLLERHEFCEFTFDMSDKLLKVSFGVTSFVPTILD